MTENPARSRNHGRSSRPNLVAQLTVSYSFDKEIPRYDGTRMFASVIKDPTLLLLRSELFQCRPQIQNL